MSNNTSVPPGVLARQHLDYIIQEQARRDRRLNMADLRAFFYKRCVEIRRPAEEEHEEDVTSSSAQHHQQVDVLEDAAFPEFSLFGHIYTDIPDTDSDSSTEIFPFDEVSHEDSPVKPTVDAPANEASTAHTVSGSAPTGGIAFTKTSIIDNSTTSEPASEANEWLVFDSKEPVDLYDTAYESDQLEKMAMEIDTSAHQDAVSTSKEHTTTPLYPNLPPTRPIFPHGEPDLSAPEPFPAYCESYKGEGEASHFNEDVEQAYAYALSKVADERIRSEDMSFRHPSMTPFAGHGPHPSTSPSVNPEFNLHQGASGWPITPVRPRTTSRFFPSGNTPTRAPYATQNPLSKPIVVTHSMRSSEILGHASSSTSAHPMLAAQPSDLASKYKRMAQEAVRRGRVSTADKKHMAFNAMTEMLLDSEINDELRSKFSALSNDVLRLELDIFQTPENSTGSFVGPQVIEQITPIAHAFIEYLGFLDQTLQREERDAQAVKAAVVQASSDQKASPEMKFRGMIRPILRYATQHPISSILPLIPGSKSQLIKCSRNLKRPRPAEHRLLQIFIDLYDAYVYSDFLNIYNYQIIHDTVLYAERMAVSRLLISIWTILQRTVDNYKAIMVVNDELKAQFISPAMGTVANYQAIWDDENVAYQQEVDGGVRLGA
ncbi:uncharacterized protein LDX57_001462 [Aspergillus melleus]|uniref:uncharacterized protein n=1 Tax=Aspergillus melleus TaxID=138277 RepID=UPI001E8E50BF|nr:uncharacterized protein LDX57_001462 [Aspergillus melleus]KAH8423705.1 hypothetical protein LDX57_001462 [Aspergillus melleus]